MRTLSRIFGLLVVLMSPALALAGGAPTAPGSGTATVSPLDATVATGGTWTVVYAATDPFTNGTLRFTIPAGWTAPQNSNPTSPGYVTVTSDHVGAGLSVSASGQQVTVSVTDLPKPKIITLVYGDTNGGASPGAKAVPPSASNPSAVFVVESDPEGTALQPIAASPAVNLQPGTINKLQFSNVAYVFQTTTEGGPYSVVARDTYGNPSPVSGDRTINLSSTSGTGTFSVLPGGSFVPVTSVTMTAGTHTVTFYYRDTAAGNPTITAAAQGQSWSNASQQQIVNAGPAGILELAAGDPTVTVDEYARITIDVTDIYGNPTTLSSNRSLGLTSTATALAAANLVSPEQASGEFYLPGDHTTPISALLMTTGQQTAEVDFRSTNANGGNPHLIVILNDDPPPLSGSVNVTVLPGPVSQAASVVAANTPVTAGVSPSAVTVTVTDQYGNPISGVAVSLACTGNASHTNPGTPTGSDGRATGAVMDSKAEAVTVTATAGGFPIVDNAVVSFVPGPASGATSLVDAVSPGVADGSSQTQITVTALDQFGNPVSGVPATLGALPVGQGETLTQPPGLTDTNGHAYGYLRSTKTGSWTVSAAVNGTPVSDGATILFAPGAAATFQWSVDGAAVAGVYEDVTLTVRDELNNIVTDFADTAFVSTTSAGPELWATGGGALGEADSLANGQWFYVFNAGDNGSATLRVWVRRAGSITLFAQGEGAEGTSSSITVDNAIADRIAIVSGDDQTAVAGSAVANNLVVVVRDEFGNLVDGASVTFGNVTGGGSRDVVGGGVVDSVATTNGSGQALCDVWRLGPLVASSNTVTARIAPSASVPSVVFSATATPGPGTGIVWNLSSKPVTVNAEETVIATLRDDNTNPVPGKTVTISITDAPNGILKASPLHTTTGGTTLRQGITDANGQTSVIYKAPSTAGLQDVVDAFGDQATLDDVTDLVFTSVASGATNLRFVWLSGSTSPAGQTFSFRVEAVDGSGNIDTGNTSTVNLVPQSGSGLVFSLTDFGGQTTTAPLVAGQRIVYGRGTTSGSWTIGINAAGLGPDTDTVQINSTGVVDHYDVTASTSAVTAGAAFNVTVTARDQYGNQVNIPVSNVSLDPVDPATNNVVTPALLVTTTNLVSGQSVVAESYTKARSIKVRARDASLKVGYSGTIVVDPAALDHIVRVTLDQSNVVAGSTVQHTAEVQDLYNNPVPGETVSFSAPQGGGSVNPASAPSGSDGRVTFNHTTGIVVGLNVARAQILDGTAPLHRVEWNVQTIAGTLVDHYDVTASTGSVTAGASFSVTIVARDQYGNKVTTANNSVNLDPVDPVTQNVVTPALPVASTTLVSGEKIVNESYTLARSIKVRARDASLKTGFSQEIVVNPATAYEVVKISGDGTIAVGGVQPLEVEVRDSFANPVPSHTVVFSVTSSPGGTAYVDPTITITDASGRATADLHTSFAAGANTAKASINDSNPPALETKTFTVNTSAGAIDHYEVAVPSGTNQVAGVAFNFTVTARDVNNNLVPDNVTVVDLSLAKGSGATFSEDPVTLVNGTFTRTLTSNPAQVIQIRAQTLGTPSVFGLSPDITVAPNIASGTITATAVPDTITADGIGTSVITSGVIRDAYSNIVASGTQVTVTPSLGSILGDVNPGVPGIQRQTDANGRISFVLQAGTIAGPANVTMQAVAPGTATGSVQVRFAPKPVFPTPGSPTPSIVTPGSSSGFTVVVQNTSATGVTLSTSTTFRFTDGVDTYQSSLGAATYVDGSSSKTLSFPPQSIPAGMDPGLYTPILNLNGTDEFGASFSQLDLSLPANSLRVVAIEIATISREAATISLGQTQDVTVAVHNMGPVAATIESVTFAFSAGNTYFSYNPIVSVNIPGTTTTNIVIPVTVLQTAPIGPTTIDAAVSGTVGGTPVTDGSYLPNTLPTWNVQSGADLSYVDGSLTPATVSRTRTHSIKVQLTNNGGNSVELQRPGTKLSFSDGSATYQATLSQNETFGVGVTKEIAFDAVQVPPAIQADQNYDVKLHLVGLENLQVFTLEDSTSSQGDFIRVVTPANVSYAGSLVPTTVTRTVSSSFSLNVTNSGSASVQLTAGSTTFSFGGGTYTATLNPSFGSTIAPKATTTLVFNAQVVNTAVGSYTPTLHLVGTENSLVFDGTPAVSNQVTVQNPADVSIVSVRSHQNSITRDQVRSFDVTMTVVNNSQADVRFDNAGLRFLLGGTTDQTTRFVRQAPTGFDANGATLPGGELDSLIFTVSDNTGNTMTVGSYVIEGNLCVTDVVSQQQICVNTALGGKGSLIVQTPGVLSILSTAASQPAVTTNQTEPWTASVRVQNTGGAEIELDLAAASTFVSFSLGTGWVSTLQTPGPIVLAGGVTDTLFFEVTPSGNTAGTATINGQVRGTELNSGVLKTDNAPAAAGSILVQTPANISITSVVKSRDPVTEGQAASWTIAATVRNTGGATADLSNLPAETYVEFLATVPPNYRVTGPSGSLELLGGGQTVLTFTISPTPSFGGIAGTKTFAVRVAGEERNRALPLVATSASSVFVELTPDPQYVAGSLTPAAVKAGDEAQFSVKVTERAGAATINLDGALTKIYFKDSQNNVFQRLLDTDSTTAIAPGGTTKIWFEKAIVPSNFIAGQYPVTVTVAGTENGNLFSRVFTEDNIEIRPPTSVRIDRMVASRDMVSQNQTRPWEVRMVVSNTGSGDVQVKPGPATRLVMRVGGVDVTSQYGWTSNFLFEDNGTNILPSGATDALVFTINSTGSSPGNLSIYGIFAGFDTGALKDVGDDTFDAGWGTILVQRAATLQVTGVATSQLTVTQGQTASWTATASVRNTGEAAVRLTFDATNPNIRFVPDSGFDWTRPTQLQGGGTIVAGGATGTLVFSASPTGTSPGTPEIHAVVAGVDTNSLFAKSYDTEVSGSGFGSIIVQERGRALVQSTTIVSPNAPEVNVGQRFPVRVQIQNTGGASLKNVSYSISSSGASAPRSPDTDVLVAPLIAGGAAVIDTFFVTADNTTGPETLTVDVTGATDVNSNQSGLFDDGPDVDSTDVMQKVGPSVLAINSVTPNQPTVTRSQTADWFVDVAVTNTGGAPLDVVTLAPADISFRLGTTPLTGYVVLAPARFVEKAGLRLAALESATLRYTVDVTGSTTGTVTIRSDLDWKDVNDLDVAAVQGTGTVRVVAPSGLFVNTTKADPTTAPNSTGNSVRVDSGQLFTMEVNVQNIGSLVEDVDSVQVRLTSNHPTNPDTLYSEFAQILRGQSHTFRFVDVSPVPLSPSASARTDLFTATIIRAKSMSSGEQIYPGQPVDNTESVILEKPANLDLNALASDNSVSTGQLFTISGTVANTGVGQVDDTGELTIRLPLGFALEPVPTDTTAGFTVGEAISWQVRAPSSAASDQPIEVKITKRPLALNTALAPAVFDSVDVLLIDVATEGGFSADTLFVSAPAGAMDDTVSTLQQFTLRASAIAEASTGNMVASLKLVEPGVFTLENVIDPLDRTLTRGAGGQVTATWRVSAPEVAGPGTFQVRFTGRDINSDKEVFVDTDSLDIAVVARANLSVSAAIVRPPEATDRIVAIGSRFEIDGSVGNLGDAGIDPANARVTIDFSQAEGYTLAAGTAERSFTIGETVTWIVDAPDFPAPASSIRIRISSVPDDENTGKLSAVDNNLVSIAISTEGVFITADNISAALGFGTRVVPKGTTGIGMLGIELANTDDAADPAQLDSVLVTILDKNGAPAANLSRTLTEFYATIDGYPVDGDLGTNPVVFVFTPGNIVLDPNGADTDSIVFAVSVASNAALDELTLSVESADHLVLKSTISGKNVPVVDKSTLQSIVGRLRSSPLVILSSSFEEYAHNYPNPFRAGSEATRIAYLMDKEGPVTVAIFDVTGERVYEKQYARGEPGTGAGPQEVTWDGRNAKGEVVRNGIYVCQLEAAGQTVKIRIAVAK